MTWKIDLQYKYETVYWTNVFYIQGTALTTAINQVEELSDILKGGVQQQVTLTSARLTPAPYVRNTFTEVILNKVGTGGSTPPAPLFNVVRWDWSKPTGRAIHHYYRGGVTPSNIGTDQFFTGAAQTFNQQLLTSLFDGTFVLCDRNGVAYVSAVASPLVGMRQLRRGSKRKHTPVI